MKLPLFSHNLRAYESVRAMLADAGKAAVIHPTGTGKSFIAFRLCADNPEARVCWLSPSEHIFRTQLENLKKVTGGEAPENIMFFTYARLAMMGAAARAAVQPDYIILDEFHRCGAQKWGLGVQLLLNRYPDAAVLGLSATNIRYLDNQRDMADELFDGNVASEMSLGEAIVRGILRPPRYVLSVFAYQKDLARYEKRIRAVKSGAVREAGRKLLDALRRMLENAEGMEEIFRKHMADCSGRYLVFCSSVEHLRAMAAQAPAWFRLVDPSPHLYTAYSDDPETSAAFARFKADDSPHLKLLFCIDMLNEGIHVDDLSGVILLRPTVSPIVYKQQIGRALAANRKKDAVVFDIVMNIDNLYSIGAIEEEMQRVVAYYRAHGQEDFLVNEHFRVIDEVRDCVSLFRRLQETLSASWDLLYAAAGQYYREKGNLEIPRRYVTGDGLPLGQWLHTQRRVYQGAIRGTLTDAQIQKLNAIGMCWKSADDRRWDRYYAAAKAYAAEYGHLRARIGDGCYAGVELGRWLAQLREYRKAGVRTAFLTPGRIAALDSMGMIWDVPDYLWEQNYHAALQYYRKKGNLAVPADYVDGNGIRLGVWLSNIRHARHVPGSGRAELTVEKIRLLDAIGMQWENKYQLAWERAYGAAQNYLKTHGDLNVPAAYVAEDGIRLGKWIRHQRENYRKNLSQERIARLEAIHMIWQPDDPWEVRYALARTYYETHGNLNIAQNYVTPERIRLGKWVYLQRTRKERLTPEQIVRLESIGVRWTAPGKQA